MPISKDEAVRIARAYGMSLTDAETLIRMADTVEEAKHIAVQFGGTADERANEYQQLERKARDAEQVAENQAFEAYRQANPKAPVAKWRPVEPDLRDGMTDNQRAQAISAARETNARGEAQARSAAADERAGTFYDWKVTLATPGQPIAGS